MFQLVVHGSLRVHFSHSPMPVIDLLDFVSAGHTEYIPRTAVRDSLTAGGSPEMQVKMSPGTKNLQKRAAAAAAASQQAQNQRIQQLTNDVTTPFGIPGLVLQLLEVNTPTSSLPVE